MIRSSNARRATSLVFICIRPNMLPSSVLMKNRLFRRSIDSIRFCRLVEQSATASSTIATVPWSLYAALDVRSGRVHGKTAARHTSDEFVDFLEDVVGLCKPKQEIHVILDNLSAHKTHKVARFLQEHPNLKLHFTPTYSSWLNQVEIWFSRIERDVIARGIFTSVRDLARKLIRYIRAYSKTARPFNWKYSDVRHRFTAC